MAALEFTDPASGVTIEFVGASAAKHELWSAMNFAHGESGRLLSDLDRYSGDEQVKRRARSAGLKIVGDQIAAEMIARFGSADKP